MPEFRPVRGARELDRAFALAKGEMRKQLPIMLRSTGRPVERAAEVNANTIGAGVPWSQMRIGSTRHSVYVAPERRGSKIPARKRPRFAVRLMSRAMIPALDSTRAEVGKSFDDLLALIERRFARG